MSRTVLRRGRGRRALLLVAATVLAIGAGLAPVAAEEPPTVSGGGSSFPEPLINKLAEGLLGEPSPFLVNYFGTGSKSGRKGFAEGTTEFAISDLPFTAEEKAAVGANGQTFAYAPFAAGALAFPYELNATDPATGQTYLVNDLKLSPVTIAKIFTGQVRSWTAPEIVADYGKQLIPRQGDNIKVVVRSDANGTTWALTSWILAVAPEVWKTYTAAHHLPEGKPIEQWPSDTEAQTIATAGGMPLRLHQLSNAIGYLAPAWLRGQEAIKEMVQIKNAAGNFVPPKSANAAKALAAGTVDADGILTPKYDVADADAYPLVMASYLIAPLNKASADTANRIAGFLQYDLAHPEQATDLDYAPLPEALSNQSKAVIAQLKESAGTASTTTTTTAPDSSSTTTTAPGSTTSTTGPCPSTTTTSSTSSTTTTTVCPPASSTTTSTTAAAMTSLPTSTGGGGSSPATQVLGATLAATGSLAWQWKLELGLLLVAGGEWIRRRRQLNLSRPSGTFRRPG
jgi:phosphate transport system substrate-binding protein